jgi:hypothetical protein
MPPIVAHPRSTAKPVRLRPLNHRGTEHGGDQHVSETSIIAQLATQFGAPGLLIGYMVWDRLLRRKDEQAERLEDLAIKRERIDSDRALTTTLATLTTIVQQLDRK